MPRQTTAPPDPAMGQQLAARLRGMRQARGWSLDHTALQTGVSKAMLGQIERAESSPTVATLWKIASGFDCSLTDLLVSPLEPGPAPLQTLPDVRRADALRRRPAQDTMLVAALFPFDAKLGFELLELTLLPGYALDSEPHAQGVTEHVVVLSGQMEVLINGHWTLLASGDAVRFAADQTHGYRNPGSEPTVCLDLIHYPQRRTGL